MYCANNPVKYVDPDGRFLFTAIGAFVGGATAAIKGGSWSDIGKGALAGAVAGAVIDITIASGGAGGVLIAAGGISAMAGEATHQALYSKSDIGDILMAGGTGLAMGMFGEMAGPVFRSLKGVFKGRKAIVEFEPLSQGTILDDISNGNVKNPFGSKGKPDHQSKVAELAEKARVDNPGMDIITEQKIKVANSNRRPDVQVVDPNTKRTIKIYEAERHPNSTRNQKREAEYSRLGIPFETHKVGGN